MVIYGDYHTHSVHSHGKQTILESAKMAKQKGLKQIAITDHGFNQFFGINRNDLDLMRAECIEAEKQTGVKVYLGIEANLISKDGDIDLPEDYIKKLDLIIVGFHKIVKAKSIWDKLSFIWANILKIKTKKMIDKNTNAIIQAIKKYPIDIISHPGVGFPIDMAKVGKIAKEYGTKMEINGKRIAYNQQEIKQLVSDGVEFVLSSDAHSAERVGECDKGWNFALKNNIPFELLSNYGKRPNFRYNKGE